MKRIKLFNTELNRIVSGYDEYYLHSEDDDYYYVACVDIDDDGRITKVFDDGFFKDTCHYEVIEPESGFPIENCRVWDASCSRTGKHGPYTVISQDVNVCVCRNSRGVLCEYERYEVIKPNPMTTQEIAERVGNLAGTVGILELQDEIKKRGIEGE